MTTSRAARERPERGKTRTCSPEWTAWNVVSVPVKPLTLRLRRAKRVVELTGKVIVRELRRKRLRPSEALAEVLPRREYL